MFMKMIASIGTSIQKFSKEIILALLLASTVFFIAPLTVFLVNSDILPVSFKDTWRFFLIYTLIAFLVLVFVIIVFQKGRIPLVAIYLGLTIAFIVQGNFQLYSLGKLDGQPIQWNDFDKYLPLELIIWGGSIGVCLWFREKLYRNALFVTTLLLIANTIPILSVITTKDLSPSTNPIKTYYDYSREFEFSDQQNIVVIILDTFRSDAFNELVKNNSQYADAFKDFTYFPNTVAGYPTTKPSLPLILTGAYNDNSLPHNEYMSFYKDKSLPYFLKNNEIYVEGYMYTGAFFNDWQNKTTNMPTQYILEEVHKELYVVFIRHLPMPLKKYFVQQFYSGRNFYHKNLFEFYHNSVKTTVKNKPPVFKFIHLSGVHPPFQVNSSFDRVDEGYMEQAKANLNAVERLLKRMQAVGAYDNSIIIIMADHGSNIPLPLEYIQMNNIPGNDPVKLTREVIAHAYPLLLAKDFNQKNSTLKESTAPVSVMDLPKTIAVSLSLENDFPGYSIFDEIPPDRIRRYFYYQWNHLDWNKPFLPDMYEFEIQGNVADSNSWMFSYKEYSEKGVQEINLP